MLTVKQIIYTSVLVCALLSTAAAQDSASTPAQTSSPTITGSRSAISFVISVAPSSRLESPRAARWDARSH